MKTIIHINQHIIRANRQNGVCDPPITVKVYRHNRRATKADIIVEGKVVATIRYSPDKPLSCGAHCWVETQHDVVVVE